MRVEDQRFIDWDHYKFALWQTQLNFVVFCASSACGVSVGHMHAKKPMISIYLFHVYYHIRRILKILEIPLPDENSFNIIIHITMKSLWRFVESMKLVMI